MTDKFIITALLLLPTFIFGQERIARYNELEKSEIFKADSFVISRIGVERFNKYFRFEYFYYNIKQTQSTTTSFDISDPRVNNIVTSYEINIPELNFETTTHLVFDRAKNKRYFEDSLEIPQFLLTNSNLDLLDTGEIKKVLVEQGISRDKIYLVNCYYSDSLKVFISIANEVVIPFDKFTNRITVNQYLIDAKIGEVLSVKKNLEIDYTPRGHWFWDGLVGNEQRFPKNTLLDSIFPFDDIGEVRITDTKGNYSLSKKQISYLIRSMKLSSYLGGLSVKPTDFQVRLFDKKDKAEKKQLIYFSKTAIHFDTGVDKWGNRFQGSFIMPATFDIINLTRDK